MQPYMFVRDAFGFALLNMTACVYVRHQRWINACNDKDPCFVLREPRSAELLNAPPAPGEHSPPRSSYLETSVPTASRLRSSYVWEGIRKGRRT